MSILLDFVALFFPNYCLGCSGAMVKGEDILCTHCLADLPKTNYHIKSKNPIEEKLHGRIIVKHAWAFLKFRKEGIVQHLLHQLKYKNHPEVGVRLGLIYGNEIKKAGFEQEFDLIIPVPLHVSRKRKRGYNQSAKFAEGLSQALQIPWDEKISLRETYTETQTKKNRAARWSNVENVFSISVAESIKGKKVLLVDDVVTTGATLEACGKHLLDSGCSELSFVCIAEA